MQIKGITLERFTKVIEKIYSASYSSSNKGIGIFSSFFNPFGEKAKSTLQLPQRIGVAVSGGVDSMALTYLCSKYFIPKGIPVTAFTIDHSFRKESAEEVIKVGDLVKQLGMFYIYSLIYANKTLSSILTVYYH